MLFERRSDNGAGDIGYHPPGVGVARVEVEAARNGGALVFNPEAPDENGVNQHHRQSRPADESVNGYVAGTHYHEYRRGNVQHDAQRQERQHEFGYG